MSIFGAIANAEHTAVAWIEKEWSKLQTEAPKIEQVADAGFKYATASLTIVLEQVGATSPAGSVISEAIKDITTLSAVVFDAGASPTVSGLIGDVVTNLSGLLSAGHISNAGSVATVTKVVSTLAALVSAFATLAPAVA